MAELAVPKMRVDVSDIQQARELLTGRVGQTPLREAPSLSADTPQGKKHVYLKLECLQEVGSFKIRGAFNKLLHLTPEERAQGVVAVSSGNHGISVSYAARQLGIEHAKIFVSESTPAVKVNKIRQYGAEVVRIGKTNNETEAYVRDYLSRNKVTFVDPCSRDYLVYAGQGTIGLEILEQVPQIDTIVVPIGGGGLLTGISVAAKALNPNIRIIGVEPEASPSMTAAMRDKTFYEEYPIKPSLCDALVGGIGWIAYQMAEQCIDDIIIVSEPYIRQAMGLLCCEEGLAVEGSSAITVGALLQEGTACFGSNTAMVISGGNVDKSTLETIAAEYQKKEV